MRRRLVWIQGKPKQVIEATVRWEWIAGIGLGGIDEGPATGTGTMELVVPKGAVITELTRLEPIQANSVPIELPELVNPEDLTLLLPNNVSLTFDKYSISRELIRLVSGESSNGDKDHFQSYRMKIQANAFLAYGFKAYLDIQAQGNRADGQSRIRDVTFPFNFNQANNVIGAHVINSLSSWDSSFQSLSPDGFLASTAIVWPVKQGTTLGTTEFNGQWNPDTPYSIRFLPQDT